MPATAAPRLAQDFRPEPLGTWGKTWRFVVALVFGLAVFVGSVGTALEDATTQPEPALVLVDVLAGVLALVLLWFRRRWPLAVGMIVAAFSAFSALSIGAVILTVVSVATRRRWREVLLIGVLWLAGGFTFEQIYPTVEGAAPWWVTALISVLLYGICIAIGFYIGARRELVATLQLRAETAEREQSARVDQARTQERSRIAREMHDVLAHRISLVAMHSGALAYRTDLTREETADAAAIIRDNAHLALRELREVLGVLRDDDASGDGRPELPQPTLVVLDALVAEARSIGAEIDFTMALPVSAHLTDLPDSTSRSAYRIVQEALTNARKHAPGAPVVVNVTGAPGEGISLEVRNPAVTRAGAPLPPSGLGLTGLTERAELAGGTLTSGVDRSGDFVVRAWLPWQR
ncbi:two-component sensor histidine kinase [Flavimobilis marinus]|uniref:histidine kinase n=1 Tax=Flavimobilis marinus TaxID=285351 RepID=A0A1I2HTY0_9MICO|nr:histidine kinase [Flavimobilis marinus]GHG49230.1 two-component sensor histidine kinase [Flavimobilis marinus]SFF33655.1 Signal transduction histidine kinase [Flavimobilis marinus]